jgi:iron complex transport system substrate-binding protein
VRELVERGESIYAVDADLLLRLAPDLIVTQDLCHVCAASPEDLAAVLARLPNESMPRIVSTTPHTLSDVWSSIAEIGTAAGRTQESSLLAEQLACEVGVLAHSLANVSRPRVLCLEWFDPPYVAGHWVPEMVRLAGGQDVLGREGQGSARVTWQQILDAWPEVIVLMSCGYDVRRNLAAWSDTTLPDGWSELPAVATGRVHAVDANAYFSRPGPRLAQGVALLANLFHPECAEVKATPEQLRRA